MRTFFLIMCISFIGINSTSWASLHPLYLEEHHVGKPAGTHFERSLQCEQLQSILAAYNNSTQFDQWLSEQKITPTNPNTMPLPSPLPGTNIECKMVQGQAARAIDYQKHGSAFLAWKKEKEKLQSTKK